MTVYRSFDDAKRAGGAGYDNRDIADVVAHKTVMPISGEIAPEQATNSILAVALASEQRPVRVLDFGGGCGFHYRWVVSAGIPVQWAIVETATMAKRSNDVSGGDFVAFTDIESANDHLGGVDLVHISGALQYVADPLQSLTDLIQSRPRFVALLRFPLWGGETIITLQPSVLSANGLGPMPPHIKDRKVNYPITLVNFQRVLKIMENYEVCLAFDCPSVFGQGARGGNIIFRLKS